MHHPESLRRGGHRPVLLSSHRIFSEHYCF